MKFSEIEALAARSKGGAAELEKLLKRPVAVSELQETKDDRWLSEMTRAIFQAGFNWDLIDKRWSQFEEAFEGFDITRWVFMSDDDLDVLLKAPGLVANAQKIRSVAGNAAFISDIGKSHGTVGKWFASWPFERYMELCLEIKARGSRLGGMTGQRVMRTMCKDALIFSSAVVRALNVFGVISGEPSSKKDHAAVQAALNAWHDETGRGLTHISQILAFSTDP